MGTTETNSSGNPSIELLALLELMRPPEPRRKPQKNLEAAACFNDLELAKKFLAAGSTPKERQAALNYAVSRRNVELINALLEAGPVEAGPALANAAELGDIAIMKRLLETKPDLKVHGDAALAAAARKNKLEAVKLLFENGVPLLRKRSALIDAASYSSVDVLKFFFANGVTAADAGNALRAAAASLLSFAGIKFLVDAGVNPKEHPHYHFDFNGQPVNPPVLPADLAERADKKLVADYLRGNPIDEQALLAKEKKAQDYWATPVTEEEIREERAKKTAHLLRGAARAEAVQKACALARRPEMKEHLNQANQHGLTPLILAADNGDAEIVTALLEAGADPNLPDNRGCPPIHSAAYSGHIEAVAALLRGGAAPNPTQKPNWPALVEAADWDDLEMVKLLIEAGADPKVKNEQGQTAMSVQHGLNGRTIKAMLIEAAKKKAGAKWDKGQGLSFVGKKKLVDLRAAKGVQDFRKLYYKSRPEWSVAMVKAPIEDVAKHYAEFVKAARWEKDIAKRKISPGYRCVHLLQLRNSPWTLILRSLGFVHADDLEGIEREAREISKALHAPAYCYLAEDTSGAEGYIFFENGDQMESATNGDSEEFESKLRSKPKFDEKIFPDPVFADAGIYLPACHPEDDGFEIKLVLEGLQKEDVARADMVVLEE